ncbi:MAG: Asp-tRNA(Asn)/Glu-tRNA(Gln) amidotransferase subunit GatB [SAR202 cluster bacterium]|nr:Asp-tRNA(Asn)/Glu-tRNA(Gln) amidotransferase subunit GatB [SAR202 cluster bacterium]
MTEYEPVIGLEVHAQIRTRSKMFCGCPADYHDAPPNSHVCPVCLALPGSLPVINREAVRAVIMTGLALRATIAEHTKFDRKNYTYPDLMKGYQISQYDLPICTGGYLEFDLDGQTKRVGITRVHLEEDVAKLFHRIDPATGEPYSLVDVNRSGVPLMEMVGEPDIRSAEEARQYLMKYRAILQFLGVSEGNMEEGNFRCDANVSIRPKGSREYGTKVEVKNMNSFRAVYRALQFELERQARLLDGGKRVAQETRGWVEERGETVSMRSKEHAHDYRYFPEPDLPPLHISRAWVSEIAERTPELPDEKRARYVTHYGLSAYDAAMLTLAPATARFFEGVLEAGGDGRAAAIAKPAANWIITEFGRLLNDTRTQIEESNVKPAHLAELIGLIEQNVIGTAQAKTAFEEMFRSGKTAKAVVDELGLRQITDSGALADSVRQAIAQYPQAVDDFRKGKDAASKFLVGQVMKLTKGKANPTVVAQVVKEQLEALR